jgi:hypothetical protein
MTIASVSSTYLLLTERHYLGPTKAASFAWQDEGGAMVFAAPRGRHVPPAWLELVRWCITGGPNAGSSQWSRFADYARERMEVTTVVSYSDPAQGHTGALYRASNWLWAPTWHRLRPPPSGNGSWVPGQVQAVKDRWIYPLRPDPLREERLRINDSGLRAKFEWAEYREPTWRRGRFDPRSGGGDYKRWVSRLAVGA